MAIVGSVTIVLSIIFRRRSPLTEQEREESSQALNLDLPVVDTSASYRQERRSQARDGANIRESVS